MRRTPALCDAEYVGCIGAAAEEELEQELLLEGVVPGSGRHVDDDGDDVSKREKVLLYCLEGWNGEMLLIAWWLWL